MSQLHTCENNPEPSFKERFINHADLIVEGIITSKTFFLYKTKQKQNMPFEYYASDSNGIWFVKYNIKVHKIFKGEYLTSVSVICPSQEHPYFSPKRIRGRRTHGIDMFDDFPLNQFAVFCLSKKLSSVLRLDSFSYYFVPYLCCLGGGYNKIQITEIKVLDAGEIRHFDNVEKFYEYLEKQIGKEKTTIIDKKYIVFKNQMEVEDYKRTHFQDSAYYYGDRIEKGIINQLNKDSFIVKPKPPKSEQEIRILQMKTDSMNRAADEFEKRMRELQKFIEERDKKKPTKIEDLFFKSPIIPLDSAIRFKALNKKASQ